MDPIFIIFAIISSLAVIVLIREKREFNMRNKPCLKGHKWKEMPVEGDDDYFYLQCQDCNKTLGEVLKEP